MNAKRTRPTLVRACVALLAMLGVMLCVSPAVAETLSVSGTDSYFEDKKDVDVLSVTGQDGKTVYIDLEKAGGAPQTLASHLAFTLSDESGQKDANGDVVGVVTVDFGESFDTSSTYTIKVFSDREEKNQIYAGSISTIFAQYGNSDPQPLAVRTQKSGENRPLSVPQTQTYNSVTYELSSNELKTVDGKKIYTYEAAKSIADSTDAHVSYYANGNENPVKVDTVQLAKDESKKVDVPLIVADESGNLYRTLLLDNAVTLSYPGITEQSVMCKPLSSEWGSVGSFYTAVIKYVDPTGKSLGVADSVIVNKTYVYTAPTYLYVSESGTVREYKIKDASKATVRLEPNQAEGKVEYNIEYDVVQDDEPRTWTVILENGSVSPKDAKRIIDRVTYTGKPGQTVSHTTKQKITVDGVDYVPTNTAQKTYEHAFGVADMGVEQTIYYVPDGYVEPDPYDVTVKYVNIANNEVIDTQAYTASPTMRADLEITSPESFSSNGIEWVRLNGQEAPIRHSYYSSAREYVVYYRDVNDDLHARTVIRTVRVVYVDEEGNTVTRPTTVVDNGATDGGTTDGGATGTTGDEAAAGGATDGATATGDGATAQGAEATDTGIQTGADLLSIEGDNGSTLTTQDGTDLATTRIEDDETPLASSNSKDTASKANTQAMIIGGVAAGVAAVAALLYFFVFKRRKRGTDESSEDDRTV